MQREEHQSTNLPEPAAIAELRALVQRAKGGDVAALPRLREILDNYPEVWEHAGDLEKIVVRAWTDLLAGDDPLGLEAVRRKADQLRTDLEGDNPTPIERLLVGGVVSTWLELAHAQLQGATPGSKRAGVANYDLRRSESAQKRHLAAIRTLTTVRALVPRGLLPVNLLRIYDPERKQA
jgi:hypothetical protein